MGFNIMDLMNGATRAAVEGVDNYEAITLNLDEIKVTKHNRYSIDFCGYIHYADHKKARKSSIRKLKQDVKAYELGELPPEEFNRKYESRKGHLGHADTYHIAKAVEYELLFYEWERLEATA